MAERETWTVEQCAAAWGIKPATWRDAVSDGRAPQPLDGFDNDRKRRWDAEAVRNFPRPGQGRRNDLSAADRRGETAAEPETEFPGAQPAPRSPQDL